MVSIAMATYNGAKYLREQIDSVLCQTYQVFELVVCDDNSTDETVSILSDYAARDERVRFYVNERNLGFRDNFINAITLCKGDYIALCDQDDIWMSDHLETLLNLIGENSLACGNSTLINSKGELLGMTLKEQECFDCMPDVSWDMLESILFFRNPFQGSSMLIRKKFIQQCLPIPVGVEFHDTWFAVCACANNCLVYTDKVIGKYRIHGTNVSGNRVKRKCWMRYFLKCSVMGLKANDRAYIIDGLIDKFFAIESDNYKRLKSYKDRFLNANKAIQKLSNFWFLVKKIKIIYCL